MHYCTLQGALFSGPVLVWGSVSVAAVGVCQEASFRTIIKIETRVTGTKHVARSKGALPCPIHAHTHTHTHTPKARKSTAQNFQKEPKRPLFNILPGPRYIAPCPGDSQEPAHQKPGTMRMEASAKRRASMCARSRGSKQTKPGL